VLFAVFVLAFVAGVVRPDFLAIAVLLVLEPLAFIACAVGVVVAAVAVGFVVFPFPIVNVAISMNQSTSAVGFVVFPVAFVKRAIDPDLHTTAVFATSFIPLAFVLSAVIQRDEWPLHALGSIRGHRWFVVERFERVSDLHDELAGFLNLRGRLRVDWRAVIRTHTASRDKTVLFLHDSARNHASPNALHCQDSLERPCNIVQ